MSSGGRSPLLSSMAVLSGPITLYMRPDDAPKSDENGDVATRTEWSAPDSVASIAEKVASLDFVTCGLCAVFLGCVVVVTFLCGRRMQRIRDGPSSKATPLPVAGEAVVVLDCTVAGSKRRSWPTLLAKNKLVHCIEVNTLGDLVSLSADLDHALPEHFGDVGAVVVVEPWCLFEASQGSSIDQIGVSRYVENTMRGLRRFADSHGVTSDHDAPIPVLGCSVMYGLLQLSRPSMCGFFPSVWVHTEDDSLLKGNRPVPDAARVAMQAVADEWSRDQQMAKEKKEKEAKQAIKREEKKSKKKTL